MVQEVQSLQAFLVVLAQHLVLCYQGILAYPWVQAVRVVQPVQAGIRSKTGQPCCKCHPGPCLLRGSRRVRVFRQLRRVRLVLVLQALQENRLRNHNLSVKLVRITSKVPTHIVDSCLLSSESSPLCAQWLRDSYNALMEPIHKFHNLPSIHCTCLPSWFCSTNPPVFVFWSTLW